MIYIYICGCRQGLISKVQIYYIYKFTLMKNDSMCNNDDIPCT
jgi:hypothetical protein